MYTAEVKTSILARLQARTMTNLSAVDRRDAALLSFQGSARHVPGDASGDTSGDGDRRDLEGRLSGCLQADVLLAGAAELGPLDGPDQGVTKVLKTESEKVSRRVVHIVPPSSVSLELSPTGSSRLIINILFCVMTEDGLICWPKDTSGREIEFSAEEENEIRRAIKTDVLVMIAKGTVPMADGTVPMADGWYDMVEMPRPEPPTKKQKVSTPKEPPEERFDVESILEERPSTGRAVRWFRVRWAGYSAAWEQWRRWGEVGSPIETWEPLVNVRNTEAMEAWRSGAWHSPRCAS